MEPLIHKAPVYLVSKTLPASLCPGDPVKLQMNQDGTIAVILWLPSRLPFGLGKPREFLAGQLGPRATALIAPAVAGMANLRVRVVEVEPAQLSRNGQTSLFISVFGKPSDLQQNKGFSL